MLNMQTQKAAHWLISLALITALLINGCSINKEDPNDQDSMPDVYDSAIPESEPPGQYPYNPATPEDTNDQNIIPENHEPY